MKAAKLKVGVQKPFAFAIECDYQEPETDAEVAAATTEDYRVGAYVRGDRITARAFAYDEFGDEFVRLLKLRGWKSAEDVNGEDLKALRKIAQERLDSFARDGSKQGSSKIVSLSIADYKAMPEAVRAALTAQGIKIVAS